MFLVVAGFYLYNYDKSQSSDSKKIKKENIYLQPDFWKDITPEAFTHQIKNINDINIMTDNQQNMLHLAVLYARYPALVSLLIDRGLDYTLRDGTQNRKKALHYAILRNDIEWLKEILKYDNDLNNSIENTPFPLHFAVYHRRPLQMIKFLLEKGADPHLLTNSKNTTLILAVMPNGIQDTNFIDSKVVELLLSYKVDIRKQGSQGKTALDYMKDNEVFVKTQVFEDILKEIN